jgi:Helix-turn-helix of DDE superfamily endonuclease
MRTTRWEQVQALSAAEFRRLTGVRPPVFAAMVAVVREREVSKRQPGRPYALRLEDQVLLTLEFWREYRTHFHRAQSWGVHEATAWRIVRRVEGVVVRSGRFALPGKRAVRAVDGTVVVDVAETPVERPKKSSGPTTRARRSATPSRANSSSSWRVSASWT